MRLLRPLLVSCSFTALFVAGTAYGADFIVHRSGSTHEDGIPGLDPDVHNSCGAALCVGGTRDGLFCNTNADCPDVKDDKLRWEAGTVHVASDGYLVTGPYDSALGGYRPFELIIEPEAIVKVSSTCVTDSNGDIVFCQPKTQGGGQIFVYDGSTLIVEGATITDIRDDSEGGDTNNDGSATTPAPSYLLRFGGSADEALTDSTIKYAALVGHFGTMPVERNTFFQCGGAGNHQGTFSTHPPVRDGFPSIVNNSFEFISGTLGPGFLDVRGQSAIVWGNEFKGNAGAVVIGPTWENLFQYKNAMPEDGVTVVAHNNIKTKDGIVISPATASPDNILQQVRFRADIHHNQLVGPVGGGTIGLGLALFTETTARGNTVENYSQPFQLRMGGVPLPPSSETAALIGLQVSGNSFSMTGAQTGPQQFHEAFWTDFLTMVDAENNWWGHATGPKDASNTDGLVNARGLGLAVSNGIDYAPFLAGDPTAPLDSIHLLASVFPPPPLVPGFEDVPINVTIDDYTLGSASTGTVTVHVRDSQGTSLVTPVSKTVSSSDHQVEFDPITLPVVPRFTSAVVVEAGLVPDSPSRVEVRSKPKLFSVTRPKGEFDLQCVDDAEVGGNCDPLTIRPGNTSNLQFRFAYKFKGTVHGYLILEERTYFGAELVRTFPTISFTAPASEFGSSISQLAIYDPALNADSDPFLALHVRYWAEDDGGVEIDSGTRRVFISYDSFIATYVDTFDSMLIRRHEFPFSHMLVGEHPRIEMDLQYKVATKNVTNWKINITPIEARDADGVVLHTYYLDPDVLVSNLSTGQGQVDRLMTFDDEPVLPPGTAEVGFNLELFAPNVNRVVDRAGVSIPVREAETVVTKSIPSGVSSTSFPPVPVKLDVTANPAPGSVALEEVLGALTNLRPGPESEPLSNKSVERSAGSVAETRLIPLNRHYTLYDSLSDTGLTATVTFGYDPATDFPDEPGFDDDALVVAALNPLSGSLEALPSTHDPAQHTVTAAYEGFFSQWTVASTTTAPAASCADPTADGKTTAADALFALRAGVGSRTCAICVCDANKNGTVNASDALLILKVAVGQLPLPSCVACP